MIKGPKGANPTPRGWVSAKGELLKSQRITQAQIDEWSGVEVAPSTPQPVVEVVEVAAPVHYDWAALTKASMIEAAAEIGIELDPKKTKRALLSDLNEAQKFLSDLNEAQKSL